MFHFERRLRRRTLAVGGRFGRGAKPPPSSLGAAAADDRRSVYAQAFLHARRIARVVPPPVQQDLNLVVARERAHEVAVEIGLVLGDEDEPRGGVAAPHGGLRARPGGLGRRRRLGLGGGQPERHSLAIENGLGTGRAVRGGLERICAGGAADRSALDATALVGVRREHSTATTETRDGHRTYLRPTTEGKFEAIPGEILLSGRWSTIRRTPPRVIGKSPTRVHRKRAAHPGARVLRSLPMIPPFPPASSAWPTPAGRGKLVENF